MLCVDKTGTLTANRMAVAALQDATATLPWNAARAPPTSLPSALAHLLETAALASRSEGKDPIDAAIVAYADDALPVVTRQPRRLVREYGISANRRVLTHLWRDEQGNLLAAAKGAPESLAEWCHLEDSMRTSVLAEAARMAEGGLRVLAVAVATPGPCGEHGAFAAIDADAHRGYSVPAAVQAVMTAASAVARSPVTAVAARSAAERLAVASTSAPRSAATAAAAASMAASVATTLPGNGKGVGRPMMSMLPGSALTVAEPAAAVSAVAESTAPTVAESSVAVSAATKWSVATSSVAKSAVTESAAAPSSVAEVAAAQPLGADSPISRASPTSPAPAAGPDSPEAMAFTWLGLLGLADPLRDEIPAAVAQCSQAGVRVVMITGDHPGTAQRIASQAGITRPAVLTGAQLDDLDEKQLRGRLASTDVWARITPQQKLRLVQGFAANGAVVAMTGDGVNDAPALKAAHVGIAMGERGTDVAREAAALVLLDDRFGSIVDAIRAGRRIVDKLRKSIRYIIAMHALIAGMAILPVLLGWPPLLYPVHIVLLELIIDPACSLVFENEPAEADLMRRPPRDASLPLLSNAALVGALAQGLAPLAAVVGAYAWALGSLPLAQARAFAFTALVLANLSLILVNRAQTGAWWRSLRRPNRTLWVIVGGALSILALLLYADPLADIVQFDKLKPASLGLAVLIGAASGLFPALLRLIVAHKQPGSRAPQPPNGA